MNPDILKSEIPRDDEVKFDKQLRVEIDGIIQKIKPRLNSGERTLSYRSLQQAVMWLGMDLKERDEKDPYPNSYLPDNAIVDPPADGLRM